LPLGRRQPANSVVLDLSTVVSVEKPLLDRTLHEEIAIRFFRGKEPWRTQVAKDQILLKHLADFDLLFTDVTIPRLAWKAVGWMRLQGR
jgi:hypothetical protein